MKRKRELTDFGKNVHKRLIDKNMSINELAEALGVQPPYLSNILCGEKRDRKYTGRIMQLLEIEGD